jgi:hypothetical protein
MNTLIRIVIRYKHVVLLQLFTVYVRYLIGSAFVIAAFAMGKVIPQEHSLADVVTDNDIVGRAFASFIHSKLYWSFIGWSQLIAGLLLITQKFARLGAVIFLPMITNIFIITYSYGFIGTDVITGLMLLAGIYLVVWEVDKLQYLVKDPLPEHVVTDDCVVEKMKLWQATGLVIFVSIVVLFLFKINLLWLMLICLGEGMTAFCWYIFTNLRNDAGMEYML